MKKLTIFLLLIVSLVILAACISACWLLAGKFNGNEISPTALTGVTGDKIIIGSSAALTGSAGFLGSEYLKGAMAYLNQVNENGGVNGRKIEVISYDDQYDPSSAVTNTQKLIKQDRVFALFNYVGTPTGVKVMPLVDESGIPLVGLFSGADVFRHPLDRHIFNIRASYYQEVGTFIKGVVEELKFSKVAVLYQYDAYGFDGLKGAELALEKYNLKPVTTASYERGTLNVEEALGTIKASRAEAVVMIGTYSPMAKFIKLARAEGFNPIFQNVSFVGSEAFAKELGSDGDGVVVTEVVPPPYEKNLLIGVNDYLILLKKYYQDSEATFGSLEGYMNAVILTEALKRAGAELTREKFIAALESISNYDLGIASPVSFSRENHQGMSRIYPTYIKDGKFYLFSDWQEIKAFVKS
jgi:ABC-type branched-subunit amino acid transport system substrate-binding protein